MKKILLMTAMVCVFIGYTAQAQTENPQTASVPEKVAAEAKQGGYELIPPAELEKEYRQDPGALFFVDTRQDWAYRMQHIEGAAHLSVTPSWWYQYSPFARSDMRNILAPAHDKKLVFY